MTKFITFPNIDPIIFTIGNISFRWYSLMYILGLAFAFLVGNYRARKSNGVWTSEQVNQLLFNGYIWLIIGGRIGNVLFYELQHFLNNPFYIFYIWQGGMSFHGGLVGAIFAMIYTSYSQKRSFWQTADFIAPLIPFGLGFGRIGNFINDELWGRVTDVPWAVLFPNGGYLPRHPSQIYEATLEGLVLFIILNYFIKKERPVGSVSGLFLIGYGIFRFFIEYFREIDFNVNSYQDLITMGQLLSLIMVIFGVFIMLFSYRKSFYKGSN